MTLPWRFRRIAHWLRGCLVRLGPSACVHLRWPLRKPYERPALTLRAPGGGLGDELMCLPIIEEIKRRNPACRITLVTRRPGYFRNYPGIAEVIEDGPEPPGLKLAYDFVIPPPRPLMTLMAECVGINGNFDRITAPRVSPTADTRAAIAALRRPLVVIQPLSSAWTTNKNWPLEYWREVVRQLAADCTVLEVGTAPAFDGETFPGGFLSFAGKTSLEDLAWTISQADLFIGPSSAGMHLANAYGVASIIIFGGYESPAGYGYPGTCALYTPVECAPCWRQTCPYGLKCLHAIRPDKVIAEARARLQRAVAT